MPRKKNPHHGDSGVEAQEVGTQPKQNAEANATEAPTSEIKAHKDKMQAILNSIGAINRLRHTSKNADTATDSNAMLSQEDIDAIHAHFTIGEQVPTGYQVINAKGNGSCGPNSLAILFTAYLLNDLIHSEDLLEFQAAWNLYYPDTPIDDNHEIALNERIKSALLKKMPLENSSWRDCEAILAPMIRHYYLLHKILNSPDIMMNVKQGITDIDEYTVHMSLALFDQDIALRQQIAVDDNKEQSGSMASNPDARDNTAVDDNRQDQANPFMDEADNSSSTSLNDAIMPEHTSHKSEQSDINTRPSMQREPSRDEQPVQYYANQVKLAISRADTYLVIDNTKLSTHQDDGPSYHAFFTNEALVVAAKMLGLQTTFRMPKSRDTKDEICRLIMNIMPTCNEQMARMVRNNRAQYSASIDHFVESIPYGHYVWFNDNQEAITSDQHANERQNVNVIAEGKHFNACIPERLLNAELQILQANTQANKRSITASDDDIYNPANLVRPPKNEHIEVTPWYSLSRLYLNLQLAIKNQHYQLLQNLTNCKKTLSAILEQSKNRITACLNTTKRYTEKLILGISTRLPSRQTLFSLGKRACLGVSAILALYYAPLLCCLCMIGMSIMWYTKQSKPANSQAFRQAAMTS